MFSDFLNTVLAVGNAACKDDGFGLAPQSHSHSANLLRHGVEHSLEHLAVGLLASLGAARNVLHVLYAQESLTTAIASKHLHDLRLSVLAREAQAHELVGRQSARAFGRYRTLAVECVVHVDHLSEVVSRHADAATEMGHDDVHVLIHLAAGLGVASCGSLGVEGVEDRLALHERQTCIACACHHLVHYHGVGHESRASTLACYVVGNERAEVAHVLMAGVVKVVLHKLVHGIHATVERLEQTASANHRVKLQWDARLVEHVNHEVLAVFILVVHSHELVDLFLRVQTV